MSLADRREVEGLTDSRWLASWALARLGRPREALERIQHASPRGLHDAQLAVDLYASVEDPAKALQNILAIADELGEPDEHIEFRATLALLRMPQEEVTPALVERAGPVAFIERFPDSRALWRQKVPDDEQQTLQLIRSLTETQSRAIAEAENHVLRDGDWPVGALAQAAGRTLAETWAMLPALPLTYGDATELVEETRAARNAAGSPVLIDTGALYVLNLLGQELADAVLVEHPLSQTTSALMEDLLLTTSAELPGGEQPTLTLQWDPEAERPVAFHVSPEAAQAPRRAAESMHQLAGRLEPAAPVDTSGEGAEHHPRIAQCYSEIAATAKSRGLTVYADDRFFRRLLEAEAIPVFGTIALLRVLRTAGVLSADLHRGALQTLRNRGVVPHEPDDPAE